MHIVLANFYVYSNPLLIDLMTLIHNLVSFHFIPNLQTGNNVIKSVFCFSDKVRFKLTHQAAASIYNKKRYHSELPYQRPDLIEMMKIEVGLTTPTNVHTSFYISVRECLDC